ncbi:MAG TPA: hypothetical protein VGE31_00335 [Candidatus Paceibacterota bacterium]
MNHILDVSWRKGVSFLLLVALMLSLVVTPSVYAEGESEEDSAPVTAISDSTDEEAEDGEPADEDASEPEEESGEEANAEENSSETPAEEEGGSAEDNSTTAESVSESEVTLTEDEEVDESEVIAEETAATSTSDTEDVATTTITNSTPETTVPAASSSAGGGGNDSSNDTGVSTTSDDTVATTSDTTTEDTDTPVVPVNELTSTTTEIAATTTTVTSSTTAPTTTSATTSTTTIESGTAVALANIINIVNSNFINSDGVVFFSNFLDAITGSLDFRKLYDSMAEFGCSLTSCDQNDTTVNISNNALIENFLLLQALSGGNLIAGGADNGVINTGDAYAGLNLINVANMNFVDSDYLLVTLNAFNDVNGDIIFPSLDMLLSSLAYSPESANINLTGNANVNNDLTVDADSGNNDLVTSNGGTISTGASGATSNVFNQLNSSLIGGQNVTIMFRIHGDWAGEVFGAPDDLLWTQSPDGSVLLFDRNSTSGGAYNTGSLNLTGNNDATINNNVNVVALTGDNQITGTETGLISTGNAYAGANIVNLANGNVVGRNWIMAVINIFGDFKGNIAFGRPDLWVGEMINAPSRVQNGSVLDFKFTVINNGDSPATQVVLEDKIEAAHLKIKNASLPYTTDGNILRFDLGKIPRGGAVEVSYQAEVTGTSEGQSLTNTVTVKGRETDNNLNDNTDTATIKTYKSGGKKKPREIVREIKAVPLLAGVIGDEADTLRVKRAFPNFPLTSAYPSMRQVVTLHNPTSNIIPSVVFEDILKDPQGTVLQTEVWDLGDVLPGEEIELGYTLAFNANAPSGTYTLHSKITSGTGASDEHQNGTIIYSTGLLPERLPSLLDTLTVTTPRLTLPGFASSPTDTTMESFTLAYLFDEGGMVLPTLAGHSMSTATRQQDAWGDWSGWLDRLYAYVSSLVSKVAPAIALAWGSGREL